MSDHKKILVVLSVLLITGIACSLSGAAGQTTPIVQTVVVIATSEPPTATAEPTQTETALPTETPLPPTDTPTVAPTATQTPIPCNMAEFVADLNYTDGSDVLLGAEFTKTWRLKNVGTCSWNNTYKIVFVDGDDLNAPSSTKVTSSTIKPGESVDVSVKLKAPSSEGTYRAYFKLMAPDGTTFGIGPNAANAFWVEIETIKLVIKPGIFISAMPILP